VGMRIERLNILKIIKGILLGAVIFIIGGVIINTLVLKANIYKYGFIENKLSVNKYLALYKKKYQEKINLVYSSSSRSGSCFNQYRYGSNDIFILELTQYSDVNVSDTAVYNYILQTENKEFSQYSMTIRNHKPPFLLVTLYHMSEKGHHANLYIGGKSKKLIRDDKYLYIRFKGNRIVINSIKNYQELSIGFPGDDDMPVEFMVLKDDGKTLFMLNIHEEGNRGNNVSLLDLIDLKRI